MLVLGALALGAAFWLYKTERHGWCFIALLVGAYILFGGIRQYFVEGFVITDDGFLYSRASGLLSISSTEVNFADIEAVGGKKMLQRTTWTAAKIEIGAPVTVYDFRIHLKDKSLVQIHLRNDIEREAAPDLLKRFEKHRIPVGFDR